MFKELYILEGKPKYKVGRNILIEVEENNPLTTIFQTKRIYNTIYIVWLGYNYMAKKIKEKYEKEKG